MADTVGSEGKIKQHFTFFFFLRECDAWLSFHSRQNYCLPNISLKIAVVEGIFKLFGTRLLTFQRH